MRLCRFIDFQRCFGLAKNILAARLRKLVADGVLEVAPASDGSAYREYALTERGRGLRSVLAALQRWGDGGDVKNGESAAKRQPGWHRLFPANEGRSEE